MSKESYSETLIESLLSWALWYSRSFKDVRKPEHHIMCVHDKMSREAFSFMLKKSDKSPIIMINSNSYAKAESWFTQLQLIRIKNFAGNMFIFWPFDTYSAWSLTMAAYSATIPFAVFLKLLAIGFVGAYLSRSWYIGIVSIFPLAGAYPFMKRITFWPQAWLAHVGISLPPVGVGQFGMVYDIDINNPASCLKIFNHNGFYYGAIVEIGLLIDYIFVLFTRTDRV
ncbi:hypothetical protein BDQ17DRAFT_1335557 [Cyathus striatus]|nr:hypothetical protein BDQ17DRAFT_1335557 [Cyathus striatus]